MARPKQYALTLRILHWLMALGIIGLLTSGLMMTSGFFQGAFKFQVYGIHKATGILILLTLVLRVVIRLGSEIPQLPNTISPVEQRLAKLGHFTLYVLMFLSPFSGWVMSSAGGYGITIYGLFAWPFIPGVEGNKMLGSFAHEAHEILGEAFIIVITLHVLAVLKHYLLDRTNLLDRIWSIT